MIDLSVSKRVGYCCPIHFDQNMFNEIAVKLLIQF